MRKETIEEINKLIDELPKEKLADGFCRVVIQREKLQTCLKKAEMMLKEISSRMPLVNHPTNYDNCECVSCLLRKHFEEEVKK
jgi:hypothetical protein